MLGQFISTDICLTRMIYFLLDHRYVVQYLLGCVSGYKMHALQGSRQRKTFIFFKTKHIFRQNQLSGYPSAPTVWCVFPLWGSPISPEQGEPHEPPRGREGGPEQGHVAGGSLLAPRHCSLDFPRCFYFGLLYIDVGESWIFYTASNPMN